MQTERAICSEQPTVVQDVATYGSTIFHQFQADSQDRTHKRMNLVGFYSVVYTQCRPARTRLCLKLTL